MGDSNLSMNDLGGYMKTLIDNVRKNSGNNSGNK